MKTLSMLGDLTGQVALITGGAGHIGRVVATGLAERGCKLCLLDKPSSNVDAVARQIREQWKVDVEALKLDIEIESSRTGIPAFMESRFGRLDILIHTAAFVGDTKLEGWVVPLEDQSMDAVRRCLEVNLTAGFHLSQICVPLLRLRKGRIIYFSSIYGVLGPDMRLYDGTAMGNPAAYAMSKGGIVQLMRWLSTVLAPEVRVNSISLGGVFRNQPEQFVARYVARTPMQRMATEEDFMGAVAFLASDLSAYITGQNLMIDGGWSAW